MVMIARMLREDVQSKACSCAVVGLDGTTEPPGLENGYAVVDHPHIGELTTFTMPLAEQAPILQHRTRRIQTRLRGDDVVAMENFGADLTFFPAIAADQT